MQLTTLVDILEGEMPGTGGGAKTRSNLGQLYAERGRHDDAVAEFRAARRTLQTRGDADATAAIDATVKIVTSLAGAGRLAEARREAKRALAAGDVPAAAAAKLQRILATPTGRAR